MSIAAYRHCASQFERDEIDAERRSAVFADRCNEINREIMAAVLRREPDALIDGYMVSSYPRKGEHPGTVCEALAEATDSSDSSIPTMADCLAFMVRIAFKDAQAMEMIELLASAAAHGQALGEQSE